MGEDRARFPAAEALLAETSLARVTKASGRTRQVRFRYAANRRMRHVIDWWMFVTAREDPWSKTIYDHDHAGARGQGKHRAPRPHGGTPQSGVQAGRRPPAGLQPRHRRGRRHTLA